MKEKMMENSCKDCQRKGCGAYHDECPEHQAWKEQEWIKRENIRKGKRYNNRDYIKETTFRNRCRKRSGKG